jgi:hypothetical protein
VSQRFAGLDRLKGVALWAMLLHHVLMWMVGDARAKLGGARSGIAATDLAAPMFAVAAGAGAALLARRIRADGGAGTARMLRRWAVIGAWGVVLGTVVDHEIDSVGVLETLAVCGAAVSLVALFVAPGPVAWVALGSVLTAVSLPVIRWADAAGGWWERTFADSFPVVSYLAMATFGAAVAGYLGAGERRPALVRLVAVTAGTLAIVAVLGIDIGVLPVSRYPSGPAFVVPGVAATIALWALLAHLRPGVVVRGMERAGQRTLVVYVAHYGLRIVLDLGGWWASLRGPGWTAAAVAIAVAMAVLSALPAPGRRRRRSAPVGQERHRDLELARS